MTKLFDFLNEKNRASIAKESIKIGHVYRMRMDESNGIKPKLGDSFRNKYFVVLGFDDEGNVTVDGYEVDNNNGVATVTIPNKKINVLPNTGGVGVVPYVVLGLILVGGGSLYFIYFIRKRGDKNEKNHK